MRSCIIGFASRSGILPASSARGRSGLCAVAAVVKIDSLRMRDARNPQLCRRNVKKRHVRYPRGSSASRVPSVPLQTAEESSPGPVEQQETKPRSYTGIATAVTFACMVGIMWGAYGPRTGLPFETAFPYTSETTTALQGFLYKSDPMRLHTSTFYHTAYLLSEAIGIRGSYVPTRCFGGRVEF